MAVQWKVALPLHPEYRTLPMVWYVPPLSPISAAANAGHVGSNGEIPDVNQLRIPVKYLANLLTAGDTAPVVRALERMLAMRAYQREKHVDERINTAVLEQVGITQAEVEEMYHVMAIANYEDRFVIPSTHREYAENTFNVRGGCGFSLRQRLLRRHGRDQPVRQREEAHHSHQGGGLTMFDARTRPGRCRRPCACWRRCSAIPMRRCAATCRRCATLLRDERALVAVAPGRARCADRRAASAPIRWRPRPTTSSCSTAAAPPRCTCSSTCTAIRASAARR